MLELYFGNEITVAEQRKDKKKKKEEKETDICLSKLCFADTFRKYLFFLYVSTMPLRLLESEHWLPFVVIECEKPGTVTFLVQCHG